MSRYRRPRTCAEIESEIRRVALIKRYTGWSDTSLKNEQDLDLKRLYDHYPKDMRDAVRKVRKNGLEENGGGRPPTSGWYGRRPQGR